VFGALLPAFTRVTISHGEAPCDGRRECSGCRRALRWT
jgi:hypothetical protein